MEFLRKKITASGRKDLLKLLEGWLSCVEEGSHAMFYKVPDEGVIRSAVNAYDYLEALARLNAGEEPLKGLQPACNPFHVCA